MAYISFDDYLKQEQTKKHPDGEYAKKPNFQAKDSSKGYMSFNDYLEKEKWDRAYNEERSRVVRLNQQTFNARALDAYNQWRLQRSAQTAVSGATTGIRGAAERARNTYIPAQFGQRIVDRQKALEEAERLRNTYIPAQFGQRELENARKRSGTPERYDYLTGLDLKAAQAEYDDLSAYLKQDEQRYNRMKVKLASYGSNTKDSGAMAIQRFLSEYETKQARAAELERDIYGAKNIQRVAGYDQLTQSGMFEPMAEQGRKYSASGLFDAFAAKHAYINDTDDARAKADVNAMRAGTADPNAIYSLMEDDEIKVFNYLTAVRGKKAALEYLDALSEELNKRQTEKTVGNIEGMEQTTAGKVFGSALSVALAAPKAAGFVGAAFDHASGKYVSEYSPHLRYSVAQQAMRAEASKDMGEVGKFLYDTGMSIADSTSVALMTGGTGAGQAASLGIMGLGASSDTTLEAIRRGASQEQAFQMGALAGIAEAAFEKFSVEGFWKAAQAGTRGAVLKNILRQSGIEASEEICTEITNIITDDLIMGGMSEYNAAVEAYMKQGMSREDAERKANTGLAAQIGLAGLGGALSGGVSGTLAGGIGQWRGKGANGEPSVNGAIIGSGALKEDTATAPAAQATGQMNETTEQYAYTDPTTGIPMVGTRPAQDTQTGNAAADTAKPAVETEEYAYIDKTTGIPMVGTRTNIASEVTPEAIARNKTEVAGMEPVAEMDGSEFPKGSIGLVDQVTEFFKSIGNRAVNPSIGQVTLDRRGAKSSLAHGMGRNKAIAFKAVPDVIRNGKIIDFQADWKGRGYDTVVIAAPVVIKGETFYEGAILIRENRGTSFYLHEVTALENKDTNAPIKTGSKAPSDAKVPSLISLLNEVRKVNTPGSEIDFAPKTAEKSNATSGISEPAGAQNTPASLITQMTQDTALQPESQSDTISPEEERAIRSYKSGMTSYAINEKLYSDIELDEADESLVRNLDKALEKLPSYKGTTYRVLCFDRQGKDAYDAFIARHVPNALMLYGSYTSASKIPGAFDIDGTLKVRIEIEGKTGKDVSRGFGLETEQEVLYGRDVYYVTKAVETAQDGTTIIKIKEADFNDEGILSGREESVDSANQGDYSTVREVQEMDRAEREGPAGVRGLSERDTQSADYGKGRPLQGELSGGQRNSWGTEGSEQPSDGALRGQAGNLEDQRAEITEHLRKLKRDVVTMEVRPERIYTDAEMEGLANKRITEYTADDIYMIASSLKNRKGLHLKDVSRVLDTVAGGDRNLRKVLHNLIEVGHNEALGKQGRRQSSDLEALQQRYEQRGIKAGSKESAAVMKFGERGYFDKDGTWVDYTLDDLQADFPNKWKDIMETAQEDRAQYDAYIDEANEMLERIYPKMMEQAQAELESAREAAESNKQKAARQKETIATIETKIESYQEALSNKKRTDTAAYAKLKNGIEYQERRLRKAQQELNKAEQRAEDARFKAARLDEEIKNGEPLHQRKIERRKDYYHHVRASGLTFDLATLIGSKSAASEMVAGRVAAGDAGGVIGNTIDKMIGSVMGNKDISPGMVGVSDNTSPRTKWQGIMEHQGAGAYKLDSYASMADYIGMIDYMLAFDEYTSQLRDITNTIQTAADKLDRSVGKSAREANSFIEWMKDWGDMLTGKTLPFDRGAQKVLGRNVMNGVRKLNSVVRSSTLLANIRSMIVQGSAIANAMNYIPNPADWARGMRYQANAMKGDPAYADAIAQSNFLSQRNMLSPNDIIRGSILNEAKKPLGKMLNIGQNAVDRLTWWTAYAQYDAAAETPGGLDKLNRRFTRAYDNAIDYADDITRRSVAGRGVGEQPMTVKSTMVNVVAPFQTEVLNTFNTLKENVGTLLGKGATKEQKGRAAAGLVAYEIAAFAINMATQAMFGDDAVGFDFIGALMGALFGDDDEGEEEALGQRLYYNVAGTALSGIPFSSVATPMIMDEETSRVIFGANGDPSRYGTGTMGTNAAADVMKTFFFDKDSTGWEKANAAAAFFPLGGKQLVRTAQGLYTVAKGGSYKTNADGEEQLQYRTDQGILDVAQAAAFGKWALPEAREYVEKGFPILSASHTAAYKNAIANGIDGAHFLVLLDRYKALEPIKDENGKTEKTKDQQFREILFRDSTLTAEQKELIDRDVTGASYTADYSSEAMLEASQLKGSHADNVKLFEEAGGTAEKYLEYYNLYSGLEPTKDINGETIPGSRQEALRNNIMNDDDMTPEQKRQLDEALTGGKTRDYTSWFTFKLGKTSGSAYKRGKAYVAAGISETNALLIEQWMDGRKYTKADLRKYLSKLKLTDSEIEAVLEARY